MPVQKFFIGPAEEGQITRYKPWAISENAMSELRNIYQWRGSWKKRIGAAPMNQNQALLDQPQFTRLRINIGNNTEAAMNVPNASGIATQIQPGQMFSIGSTYLTVTIIGGAADPLLSTNSGSVTATINTTVTPNTITVTGSNGTPIYYYPSTPVMDFGIYLTAAINDETTFAWDTQFAYTYTFAGGWQRSDTETDAGASVWTGTNSDFFYTTNYRGAGSQNFIMFVTNNTANDKMRYYDGSWHAWGSTTTTLIDNSTSNYLKTCLIIEPWKNRLFTFNVLEAVPVPMMPDSETRYVNRIRWSQIGNPLDGTNSWRDDVIGKGGFQDLPVKQAITGVGYIKDRLIVIAESSYWELVSTNDLNQPFVLQQLNSELGVESTNSIISFDKALMGFGNNGVHATNGLNVERIDEKDPTVIFRVSNENNNLKRVAGIRDFFNEMVYWSYNDIASQHTYNLIYPNRVLCYNYTEDTWSYNDDSITAFGYYQPTADLTWNDVEKTWDEMHFPANSPTTQAKYRAIIAGNQQGWTFILDAGYSTNSMSLQFTNVSVTNNVATITCYNHNLAPNSYVYIQSIQDNTAAIETALNNKIFKVSTTTNANTFTVVMNTIFSGPASTTYKGGGIGTLVTPHDMTTKQYNFFYDKASNMAINQIDFFVDKSSNNQVDDDGNIINGGGQVTVTYYLSSSTLNTTERALQDGGMLGTGILETTPYELVPLENQQTRFWHSMYPNFFGESIAVRLYLTEEQITTGNSGVNPSIPYIAFQDFQLNAMIFYATPINPLGG